ncbi:MULTISPECIES: winged helix-turn-helix transcriptional regulator [Olivibacter]|jgi:DNA-binding HxlR family transcriptional regulator|uniref:Transcriptional regulator, HxlR family n=3 Tax=Sphingobacteriaceae TaxID=84566 RepID=F4CDP0_SPHS2|nr:MULTISPECIES: helix-turn-helix domain-containing protein [Olivibacter]MCL4640809.1 helix-turn-helix transcriptional regulator [Olivibacter sp. UJ_SKK_5.1]MDM8176146.1 helix-turn-helix domain-containing protein [Olivibacter sp. 47]MDX3915885.1 helix-turn-helix domain-containing protein [Pseudosphingobacterium sp.]QEL00908.1 helix-turn-helix transcriptional regulator [Olivibacter sp. LS-1]
MRKETSTNALNEKQINDTCGMAYSLSIIGGRWKPAILCRLAYGKMRYSDLKNSIDGISERMLVAQLRELEKDYIVKRNVYAVVPPRVEYELTDLGLTMRPMLQAMSDWGNMHRKTTVRKKDDTAVA